jgi:23S rRNA pseudouridine2605 synthase
MTRRKSEREGERIAKRIARAGLCSRREAEQWIFAGRVEVNGKKIASPALDVSAADRIKVDGKPLPERERTRLFLYHKRRGLVTSARDPEGRPTIFDRLPQHLPRLVSVGRLDLNTEGLLLLTNDGGLARVLELPKTGWLRRYRVRAHGRVSQAALDALVAGITVDGIRYGPIEARLDREQASNVWLTFAMREGKNREIRNVLGALGLQVNRLIRISFGPFQLGELPEGAVAEVATRVLREQIGERIAQEAGTDFAAPVLRQPPPLEGKSLPRTRFGVERPKAGREGGSAQKSGAEKIRRGLLTDRKGRQVAVERIGAANEERPPKPRTRRHHGRSARKRGRP